MVRAISLSIPQRPLDSIRFSLIERELQNKDLEQLYTSLNIILANLVTSKLKGSLTLEVVCNWMRCKRLPYDIINDGDLKDIKIESLIQLYEKIEEILYPQIENRYTSRFGKALTKTQNAYENAKRGS